MFVIHSFQDRETRGTNTDPGVNYEELYNQMVQERNTFCTQAKQLAERYTQLHSAHVKQQQMATSLTHDLQQVKQQVSVWN